MYYALRSKKGLLAGGRKKSVKDAGVLKTDEKITEKESAGAKKSGVGNAFAMVLAAAVAAASVYLLFLCFADACEPEKPFITATGTGIFLCPVCVLTFAAGVVYTIYRFRGDRVPSALGGISLGALPHAVMVLSLVTEVLTVTNFFNHAMEFLTSGISKLLFTVYAVLSLMLAAALFGKGTRSCR